MVIRRRVVGWIVVTLSVGLASSGCRRAPTPTVTAALVEQNNRAVGLMGQFDFEAAANAFEAVRAGAPDWPGGRLNLAVALMNRQGEADASRAERLLREPIETPHLARRARYALALLLVHEGRDAEALPLLADIATSEPPDGFAAYFAGQLRLGDAPAEALDWYRRAIAREPLLRSAYYGAFLALRRLERDAEAEAMLERFQALERNPQAVIAEFKYTRMGPLLLAVTIDSASPPPPAPSGGRFQPPLPLADAGIEWGRHAGPRSSTIADIDADGQLDVFVAGAMDGAHPNAVLLKRGERFVLDRAHPLAGVANVQAALWGDLDDDGRADVVLCRPSGGTQVWRQDAGGGWLDQTAVSGIRLDRTDIVDGAVFDADHDGDLDLWLVNRAGPNELLNNDGQWRFRAIGASSGIGGDGRPSLGLAVADLDGDRDTDVVVLKAAPPHDVFLNGRVWQYRRDEAAAALAAAPISALVAADLDADGASELYSAGARGLERWHRGAQGQWRSESLAGSNAGADAHLAVADTDGDGRFELLVSSADSWTIYDVPIEGQRWSAGPVVDGDGHAARGWTVAHLDPAAGPSIVGVAADGVPAIWRPGPGRHAFVGLAFSGRDPSSDQRRSNTSGVGARVAVRAGSRWTAFETTRQASGPGQSLQPTTIGLGGQPRADFVSITWSDGVLQTELALEARTLHRIGETQRQLSSCPILFAWDGSAFRFVTDVLGVGGVGFFEQPGRYSAPLPRENILLPPWTRPDAGGGYRLKLAEPMEEVTYLDRASLVAYDLPPGWQMALDERKAIAGPQPTGAPIFYREERLPVDARNDAGEDVTALLAKADLSAVGPRAVDPRFIGLARPYTLTVTFADPIDDGRKRPVLLIDGWVEYPYAQTVFAAWQAGAAYEAPTLEARDPAGRWHVVAREFGYPAGMPRRMAFPLPPLPPGATALRLRTSNEIYWDRLAIAYAEAAPAVRRHVLPLSAASLSARGFARRSTGPQRVPHYDDGQRVPLGDTRHPRGWYTEFGPVAPLVADEDGAVAIFGPGEEVVLTFDEAAAPREGWTRQLVLEARGWCKDMDLYTLDGETIDPVPGPQTSARARLHARFNTRYASGF